MKKMLALSLIILIFQVTQGYATVANPWLPMSLQCGEFSDSNCYARQAHYLSLYGDKSMEMTQLFDSVNPIVNKINFSNSGRTPAVFGHNSNLGVTTGFVRPNFINSHPRFFSDAGVLESGYFFPEKVHFGRSPAVVSPR